MPYFEDSYQTMAGQAMILKEIETPIKEAVIKDGLDQVSLNVIEEGGVKPIFVLGRFPSESEIPPFAHPLVLVTPRGKTLCTDMRFYVTKEAREDEIDKSIRNMTEFNFAKSRAILNLLWVTNRANMLRLDLHFAGTVYAALVSEAIAKTYALDFRDKTAVGIATHFFYQTLFTDETEFDEDTRQKMAVHTIKAMKAPSELVFQVFDKIKEMRDIKEYCQVISNVTENVRLKDFNLAMLYTIIKNSWYGTNSREILAVSMEHPPTWCAIVFASMTERTFRNSKVYQIAENFGKRGPGEEFMRNYISLIKENVKNGGRVTSALEDLNALGTFE